MTDSPPGAPTARRARDHSLVAGALRPWTGLHRAIAKRPGITARRTAWFAVLLVLLGALTLPYAFFSGFSGLQFFDDDGTLMITFRDLAHGLRLYDDIFALYGPFYYLTIGSLFTNLHVPLTHDAIRIISTVFRFACSGMLAALTYRLTRSLLGGLFTFLACVFLLQFLLYSPTHPQEICLLMAAALPHLVLSIEARPERAAAPLAATGVILGALLLTKINIGAFAAFALGLTALQVSAPGAWPRLARTLAAVAALLLPLALMSSLLHFAWVAKFWALATLTIGAALTLWLRGERQDLLAPRHWVLSLAAAAVTAAAILAAALALGSSPYAMLDAIVLQNGRLIRNWNYPLPIPLGAVGLAASALAVALWCRAAVTRPRLQHGALTAVALLKLAVGAAGVGFVALMATGMGNWGLGSALLFEIVVPFSFLMLVPTVERPTIGAGRASLALLAAFMVLYPFPVAGTQVVISLVLMVCALPVLLAEGAAEVRALRPGRLTAAFRPRPAAGLLMCAVFLGALAIQTRHAWWAWGGGMESGLPGTHLIRLAPKLRAREQWVLQQLASCPAFYTFPGLMSFYFWTGRPSPTALNSNDTLALLTPAQQDRVIADLERQPGLCIVSAPEVLEFFDRGQIVNRAPLLRYIDANFTPVAWNGPYAILKRNPSP